MSKVLKQVLLGSAVGLLLACPRPAAADLPEALPQVTFSGEVQGVSQNMVAIDTPNGAVLVPADESMFVANGAVSSPFGLAVGTPVVVSAPYAIAPQMNLADLGPVPMGTAAFPGSFNGLVATTDAPTVYAPVTAVEPVPLGAGGGKEPVAAVPANVPAPAPEYSMTYEAPRTAMAPSGPPISYLAVAPAAPPAVIYGAFQPPAWQQSYAASTVSVGAGPASLSLTSYNPYLVPPPAVFPPPYAAYPSPYYPGYAAYPAPYPSYGAPYPAPYAPYPAYPIYGAPAFSTSVGLNLGGGVGMSYNTYQPGLAYGVGFAPPYSPYPVGYGSFSTTSIGLGPVGLSFSSFNPSPFPAPCYAPPPYGVYPGPFFGSSTTISLGGGLAFSFASPPAYPYVAPFAVAPVYAPYPIAPWGYPPLGPVYGYRPNAVLVQTGGGMLAVPWAALPPPVMNQMVYVQPAGGVVQRVPFQAALAMRASGGTILSNPVIPSSTLLSRVAVMHPGGAVSEVPMVSALNARNAVILGAAGAVALQHVNPALFQHAHPFGLERTAGVTAMRTFPPHTTLHAAPAFHVGPALHHEAAFHPMHHAAAFHAVHHAAAFQGHPAFHHQATFRPVHHAAAYHGQPAMHHQAAFHASHATFHSAPAHVQHAAPPPQREPGRHH